MERITEHQIRLMLKATEIMMDQTIGKDTLKCCNQALSKTSIDRAVPMPDDHSIHQQGPPELMMTMEGFILRV